MKLNYKKTVFVGFAFFLICMFWQAYDSLVPKILTDKFGMNQAWSGFIMALDNIMGLFMLPLFGAISDRHNSKRGKRTPFIIVGTIIAAVAFIGLSLVDNWQKTNLSSVDIDNEKALYTLYDANLTIKTPDGEEVVIKERFTRDDYAAITMTVEQNGKTVSNPDYNNYVVPARQTYAWDVTAKSPVTLVFFIGLLFIALVAMATFRSPAVALMPDVTIKPLRSKANAVINLMGTAGSVIVLILGIVFGTGKAGNALMSYVPFMTLISVLMLISLLIFLWKVNEPKLVEEMKQESAKYNIEDKDEDLSGNHKLTAEEKKSLFFILASVVLWFCGYNAVTSKYSVYAGSVLNVDYNLTLLIAQGAAIVSYFPVGQLSSKIGRKKTILGGIVILTISFGVASFLRAGCSVILMDVLFAIAGVGWAAINVNSYPMVVELSTGSDVGKYTGFYYTASMAAQTLTPILSGLFLEYVSMTTLFPYATVFVALAFITMALTKHGDNKPVAKGVLESLDVED